jgi:hypothetical protein
MNNAEIAEQIKLKGSCLVDGGVFMLLYTGEFIGHGYERRASYACVVYHVYDIPRVTAMVAMEDYTLEGLQEKLQVKLTQMSQALESLNASNCG